MAAKSTRAAGWAIVGGGALLLVGALLFSLPLLPERPDPAAALSQLSKIALLAGGGSLAFLGLLMVLAGLGIYVLVPAFAGGGERARLDYGSHRVILACTILALFLGNVLAAVYFVPLAVVSYFSGAGMQRLLGDTLSPPGIAVAAVAPDLALLGIVYLRIVRTGAISWARMGLERKLLGHRVLVGLASGFVLLGLSAVLETLLQRIGIHQTQTELFRSVRTGGLGGLALVLLSGAVIAPVVEEIYFRGFIFRGYLEQKGVGRAFLYSAGIFAAVHMNVPALVPIFVMGLFLSFLFHRTGSIVPGIVAHGFNNTSAFILLYLGLS